MGMGKHSVASARPSSINWDHYKAALPAQKSWVESMEKQFNDTKIPAPSDNGLANSVNSEDGAFESMANDTCAALDAAASDAQTQHDQLVNLPPTDQLRFVQRFPGI